MRLSGLQQLLCDLDHACVFGRTSRASKNEMYLVFAWWLM